jgi:hypothetical protein
MLMAMWLVCILCGFGGLRVLLLSVGFIRVNLIQELLFSLKLPLILTCSCVGCFPPYQGPFQREEFLGCVELQRGLYAVVTVGHLLLLACRVMPAATAATATPSSPTASKGAASEQQGARPSVPLQQQQQQPEEEEARQPGAVAVQPQQKSQQQQQAPEQQPQQGQSSCVQYKDPQLVFVLDLRDVMMVAAEGSSLRLLCMAGDPAMGSIAVGDSSTPRHSAAGGSAGGAALGGSDDGSNGSSSADADGALNVDSNGSGGRGSSSGALTGLKIRRGDGVVSASGLRELLTVAGLGGRSGAGVKRPAGPSVPTAVGAGVQAGAEGLGRWQTAGSAVSFTDAELESAAAGAAAAVAAAVGGGVMGRIDGGDRSVSGTGGVDTGDASSAAAQQGAWAGCKWFVGHQVPCGSEQAALQLQQLLERACQRVETLLASSAWPRQLML